MLYFIVYNITKYFMKNIILLFLGFIIGSALVAGGLIMINRAFSTKMNEPLPIIPKQSIPIESQHIKVQTYTPEKIIPRENITSLSTTALDNTYKAHLDKTIVQLNTLIIDNNTVILPAMQSLPIRLSSGDWKNVFDEITNVKLKIGEAVKTVQQLNFELDQLESSNAQTKDSTIKEQTTTYIVASRKFTKTYSSYLAILNTLLDGSVPDQGKLQKLNSEIVILREDTENLQKQGNYLFASIKKLENKQ